MLGLGQLWWKFNCYICLANILADGVKLFTGQSYYQEQQPILCGNPHPHPWIVRQDSFVADRYNLADVKTANSDCIEIILWETGSPKFILWTRIVLSTTCCKDRLHRLQANMVNNGLESTFKLLFRWYTNLELSIWCSCSESTHDMSWIRL